ncbi:hypothetical protein C8F04DRAFT_1313308 [Mycena alexandri]|uniref:DUF6534 domain-containing protein n=1 Tax=Mycena alexandri TaxID=1745969 RepID=A0AAD6S5U9_9AGAR|nr:hypothetical protein C8F04DRAFT_1313308 [Mycena alexandri]
MSTVDTVEYRAVALILGPWLIGFGLDIFLQGILTSQFFNYYSWYKDDHQPLQIIVAILAIGTYLKSCQAFAVVWNIFIVRYGDFEGGFRLSFTAWWEAGNALMVASIGLYVQSYFCYRLWMISRRWYIAAIVETVGVFAFGAAAVVTYINSGTVSTPNIKLISFWFSSHMAAVFITDILISTLTAYYLLRARKDVLPQTAGSIDALVRLTFQTAALATLGALINLIFTQVDIPTGTPEPASILSLFSMSLAKLYAISMMWTLNARRTIRAHRSLSGERSARSAARARAELGDVELSRVQIVTQRTHHIDVDDMFHPDRSDQKNVPTKSSTSSG